MMNTQWLGHSANDRRSRILQTAQQVFAERGFRTAEVQHIAEAAGVSKATIYKLFKSKDDLLLTIVTENFQQLRSIVLRNLIGPGDAVDRLRLTLYAGAEYLDSNKPFCQVLFKEAGQLMEEIQRIYNALVMENIPLAEAFFAHFKERKLLPDISTSDLLKIITSTCIGILYSWVLANNGKLTDEVDFYFEILNRINRKKSPALHE